MYRQILSVNAKSKKEAVVNLWRAFREVLVCERGSEVSVGIFVPDDHGNIDNPEFSDLFCIFKSKEGEP